MDITNVVKRNISAPAQYEQDLCCIAQIVGSMGKIGRPLIASKMASS
ncbi:hypothetical protein [Novosphingobium sp. JCM 18896]|nr:hypothetical protein [Novosphingobium sp. JCM 18896]MCW1430794.1 hypothetical protein [Novosphingobium sp. JCM 18896]